MRFLYFVVSSSFLIVLVLLCRQLFRKKLSPGAVYALWLIPMVRLLIPFGSAEIPGVGHMAILGAPYVLFEETVEWLGNRNQEAENVQDVINISEPALHAEAADRTEKAVSPFETEQASTDVSKPGKLRESAPEEAALPGYVRVLLAVWITGSGLLGAYVLISDRRLKRSILCMEVDDPGTALCDLLVESSYMGSCGLCP